MFHLGRRLACGDQGFGFFQYWRQGFAIIFFIALGGIFWAPGLGSDQNYLLDNLVIMLNSKPGGLVAATGVTQQCHLLGSLLFQPAQPSADLVHCIFVFMSMGRGAIVGSMTVIQSQTQVDRQRAHSVLLKQLLQGGDELALVMGKRPVGNQNRRAGRPTFNLLQIGIQGEARGGECDLFSMGLAHE